jgi:hypothetical protein
MPHLLKHLTGLLLFSALGATSLTAHETTPGTDYQHQNWARKFVPDEPVTTGTLVETRTSTEVNSNRKHCFPAGLTFGNIPFEPWAVDVCQSSAH